MKTIRKLLVITLAVLMTAMTMLPSSYGGLFSYAENEEQGVVTEAVGNADSAGQTDGDEVKPDADANVDTDADADGADDAVDADTPNGAPDDIDADVGPADEGKQPEEKKEETKEPAEAPKAAPKAAPALRATQFPFTVKVGNTTTQCATWKDAIDTANANTGAVVITMTDDYTFTTADQDYPFTAGRAFTLDGAGHKLVRGDGLTGDLILIKSATQAVTIKDLTIDGNNEPNVTGCTVKRSISNGMSPMQLSNVTIINNNGSGNLIEIATAGNNQVNVELSSCTIEMDNCTGSAVQYPSTCANNSSLTISGGSITGPETNSTDNIINIVTNRTVNVTISNAALYRGQTTGMVLDNESGGTTTISGSTISGAKSASDSSSMTATKSLIKQGTGTLTLTDTTIEKHVASSAGICAVDAENGATLLNGNVNITGNTAGEKAANLKTSGTDKLKVNSALTSTVGVTSGNNGSEMQFAIRTNNVTGFDNLKADNNTNLKATASGTQLIWMKINDTPTPGNPRTIVYDPTYGQAHQPSVAHDVSVSVPLKKTLTWSGGTLSELKEAVAGHDLTFDISVSPSADISLASGDDGTEYTLDADELLDNGQVSGSSVTYSLSGSDCPWIVTFSSAGTYTITVSEDTTDPYFTYGEDYTYTCKVVEEDGVLRASELEPDDLSSTTLPSQQEISLDSLFYTHQSRGTAARITRSGNSIHMQFSDNSAGAITSNFSFDFSRSFELSGTIQIVREDGMAFAFQSKKQIQSYSREGAYGLDNHNMATGTGTAAIREYYRDGSGYNRPSRHITGSDLGNGFLFIMNNEPISGYASMRIDGLERIPYAASSGLANGHYEIISGTHQVPYGNQNYSVKFDCTDPSTGTGTLTITMGSKVIVYNNFVAKDVIGGDDWQEAYFVFGACVDNGTTGTIAIDEFEYTDDINNNTTNTTFWADRNGDGVFETQVDMYTSPAIPGEKIKVRHRLDPTSGTHAIFFTKTLITQLKDLTDGTLLTGRNAVSYKVGDPSSAIVANDQSAVAYNSYELSDGMKVAVYPGSVNTYFEFEITAPTGNNHVVMETALFGEPPFDTYSTAGTGFRTEKAIPAINTALTNQTEVCSVTYDPADGTFSDNTTANKTAHVLKGTEFTVSETPEKGVGWTLTGWKVQGSDTVYQVGESFTVSGNVTLVAQWVEARTLTVTNENYGAYSNADDNFLVTLTLEPASGDDPLVTITDERLTRIGGTWEVSDGKATTTFTVDDTDANRTHAFPNIPVGWTYAVKETADKGYTVKYKLGTEAESAYAEKANGQTGTMSADTEVNLRNERNTVVPSGIAHRGSFMAFIVIMMLVLGAALVKIMQIKHRRVVR